MSTKQAKRQAEHRKTEALQGLTGGKTAFGWLRVNDPGNIPPKGFTLFLEKCSFPD